MIFTDSHIRHQTLIACETFVSRNHPDLSGIGHAMKAFLWLETKAEQYQKTNFGRSI